MGMYAVQTADSADLAEARGGARDGVAAAKARRRQMSQGKQALMGAGPPPASVAPSPCSDAARCPRASRR